MVGVLTYIHVVAIFSLFLPNCGEFCKDCKGWEVAYQCNVQLSERVTELYGNHFTGLWYLLISLPITVVFLVSRLL